VSYLLNDVMAGHVVQVSNEAHLQAVKDNLSAYAQRTGFRLFRRGISRRWTAASSLDH